MANTILTSTLIVKEAVAALRANSAVLKALDTSYSKYFNKDMDVKKGGETVYVPMPALGVIREDTWTRSNNDEVQLSVPATINKIFGIDMELTEPERSLKVDEATYLAEFVRPKVQQIAAKIDSYAINVIKNNTFKYFHVSSLGTPPDDLAYFLQARASVLDSRASYSDLCAIIDTATEAKMVKQFAGQYNPTKEISDVFRKGQIAVAAGLDWYTAQAIPAHTHGTVVTAGTVTAFTESTLTITNVTSAGTLKAGDTLQLDSTCTALDPLTKDNLGIGQKFVVTADATASGTNITVSVLPKIYISGPNQNVSATPVGAAVTLGQTTSGQVLRNAFVLSKQAFGIAFAQLYQPKGMEIAKTYTTPDGISVRYIQGFDVSTSKLVSRLDVYFGVFPLRPEWSAVIRY